MSTKVKFKVVRTYWTAYAGVPIQAITPFMWKDLEGTKETCKDANFNDIDCYVIDTDDGNMMAFDIRDCDVIEDSAGVSFDPAQLEFLFDTDVDFTFGFEDDTPPPLPIEFGRQSKCCSNPMIVKNSANGKDFYVCRNCKKETDSIGFTSEICPIIKTFTKAKYDEELNLVDTFVGTNWRL